MSKKKNGSINLFMYLFAIAVVLFSISAFIKINDCRGITLKTAQTIEVKEGMTCSDVSKLLSDKKIIKSKFLFEIISKKGDYATKIMPGEVELCDGMSYSDILKAVCKPGRLSSDYIELVIPEGYELRQIRDEIVKLGIATEEEFNSACDASLYGYKFLEDIPKRDVELEGYLFPNTYYIDKDEDIKDVICTMLDEFDKNFNSEYYTRAEELGMSVDEIITLASIIERETDSELERAKVAGVFYNRLKIDMPLQSCATVQYILKERKDVLSNADTKIESPYNTYMNKGLPIGPIASPGIECIKAALYPEETDALYFVKGKDGKHIFSKTYEEHLNAQKNN